MKNSAKYFVMFLSFPLFNCYGINLREKVENLNEVSEEFNQQAHNLLVETQQPEQPNSSSRSRRRQKHRSHQRALEVVDDYDLSASSKQFLFRADKKRVSLFNQCFNQCINTITSPSARSFLGLLCSNFTYYIGFKSLLNHHDSKLFGYSAVFVGAAGSTAMLYDLYYRCLKR